MTEQSAENKPKEETNTVTIHDLPKPIKQHILDRCNGDDYQSKPNTYSITDLLYCLRKAYYKKTNPKPLTLDQAFNIYRGQVYDHLWTPLFRHNQVRCTHRVKNYPIVISGKYDFIDENGVITDLKTAKSLYYIKEPSPEYIAQIRFYAYCNASEKAQIVYVDFGDAKVFPVEVGDCTSLLEELEAKAILLFSALQKGKPPAKQPCPDWLCNKCEYSDSCMEEENGK